jgi:glutathione S-transferase
MSEAATPTRLRSAPKASTTKSPVGKPVPGPVGTPTPMTSKPRLRAKTSAPKASVVAKTKAAAKTKASSGKATATLTISSRNYSSWSLRGWLLVRFAGLDCEAVMVSPDDADARKELLLLAPSIRVPCLTHDGAKVWNTLAIAQYLDEVAPKARLLPEDRLMRAHCRSVCGEMNSGFANLRAALPMNLKAHHPGYKIWAGAQPDIDRIVEIWTECLAAHGGPFFFGAKRTMADAMFAPVATRFLSYDVKLNKACILYCKTIMAMPEMQAWVKAAREEPEDIEELDMDF